MYSLPTFPLHPAKFLILKIETNSLFRPYPIKICLSDLFGRSLFNNLILPPPNVEINPGSQNFHNITMDSLAWSQSFEYHYQELAIILCNQPGLPDYEIYAYNSDFVTAALRNACNFYDLPHLTNRFHCLMSSYAEYIGDYSEHLGSYAYQKLPLHTDSPHISDPTHLACLSCIDVLKLMSPESDVLAFECLRPSDFDKPELIYTRFDSLLDDLALESSLSLDDDPFL